MVQLFCRRDAEIGKAETPWCGGMAGWWANMSVSFKIGGGLKGMQICRVGLGAVVVAVLILPVISLAQNPAVVSDFAKLDASRLPISHKIHIDGDPDWLATGFGSVWVAVPKNNELVRVDPVRNVVQARVPVDKEPCYGIGIGPDRVWVLNCQSQTLTRINPKTNKVDLRVPVKIDPAGEGSIAVDARSVWFVSNEDGYASTLIQASATNGRTLRKIAVGKDSAVVKLSLGAVWVISSGENKIYRVDTAKGKVVARVNVASGPRFATVGAGSLWVLIQSDGSIARIDLRTNKVKAVIAAHVPGAGGEICYGGGLIWVTMSGTPVIRIDPVRNKVIDHYGNYPKADAIRYGFGSVWVSDHGKGDLWRIDVTKFSQQ
jgi:virginiamycin B lyase